MNRNEILASMAFGFVGIKERGENSGEMVEIFQKTTGTIGQPWCASFAWYCIDRTDEYWSLINNAQFPKSIMARSASVLNLWNGSNQMKCEAKIGSIVCWQMYRGGSPTVAGHCGIIIHAEGDKLLTVEGNTSDVNSIVREGEGVEMKRRGVYGSNDMRILGFIDPWGGQNG